MLFGIPGLELFSYLMMIQALGFAWMMTKEFESDL